MLCNDCRDGLHTNPPNGRVTCQCQEPTCNCIVAGGKPLPEHLRRLSDA